MSSVIDELIQQLNANSQLQSASHLEWVSAVNNELAEKVKNSLIIPYRYSRNFREYNSMYNLGIDSQISNFDLYVLVDDIIVGFVPLTLELNSGELSCDGENFLFPIFARDLVKDLKLVILSIYITSLRQILMCTSGRRVGFQEYQMSLPKEIGGKLVEDGCHVSQREVYVKNCQGSLGDLWKTIRKSYKPLINRGLQTLEHGIVTGRSALNYFDEFRKLHLLVSGRVTRSSSTWELQREEVRQGSSFLSYVNYSGVLAGAALISHNEFDALYAVGVYRRDLKHLNLGHLAQWIGIKNLNELGVRSYRLGTLNTIGAIAPTEKEMSIARFKRGFSDRIDHELLYSVDLTHRSY